MIKLLIVEDEEPHRELIEDALDKFAKENYSWDMVDSFKEANERLKENEFDLILLDISLPDSAYHETLSRVRDVSNNTPIIVLTSLDDRQTVMNMIRQGAKDCIPKSMLNGFFLERSITYCLDRELTQRNLLERERELEQTISFQRLFNRSKIGFVIMGPDHRLIEANPAFCNWLGYRHDEMIGKRIEDITAEEYLDTSLENMRVVQSKVEAERHLEKQYVRSDGIKVWGEVAIQPIEWKDQDNCLIGSIFDLTEHKEAEKRIQEAYESKSGIVSMISHDVRAPLTNIIAIAEFSGETELSEEIAESFAGIGRSGRAMLELIDDILIFSRAEQGGIELAERPCDVGGLIGEVLTLFEDKAREKRLHLGTSDVGEGLVLLLDGDRLKQIISNLVGNAIKFTPQEGKVEIEAKVTDETLVIRVSDTGIGISTGEQERLFRPFSQANPKIQKHYGGTGLGLSICRQLAELMNGSVQVESAPGEGSTFTVLVPANKA